jgi:hypothetical protein
MSKDDFIRWLLPVLGWMACHGMLPGQNLRLSPADGDGSALRQSAVGAYEIRGAASLLAVPDSPPPGGPLVLEFEAFCIGGVPGFTVFPGPPFEAGTRQSLPAIGHSETWTPYAARLHSGGSPWPGEWRQLRIDLPLPADRLLQLRNPRLRPERSGEFDEPAASRSTPEPFIEAYLDGTPPGMIESVSVTDDSVVITGRVGAADGPIDLADVPMDRLMDDPGRFETLDRVTPAADGSFVVTLPRFRERSGLRYDRLVSRWQLARPGDGGHAAHSHARYADEIACRSPALAPAAPTSKKGLGGWHVGRVPGAPDELRELGIAAVTVNILIHSLVSLEPGPNTTPFQWQGRTYHAREDALARLDQSFLEAAKHEAMVSAILLVANPARGGDAVVRLLGHPDAVKEGTYAMPNVTSEEGIALYGAILDLMAGRWSRPDGKYGRVHHWIVHNEVDAGWVWTNVGEKPAVVYMDLLHRSMRLTHLIARQYDPHARPFLSLTHHWAEAGNERWYGSRRMIRELVRFGEAEGDFPWALAHHPYPQNLFNPRTWEDHQATFSFDTLKITPKNIEVLDAYMKLPRYLYRGEVRPIHLSENGFNSKDYSDRELRDQAAGMAMAWKKIRDLSAIESWQYHNWVDHRNEGGLRIGLRKFPDDADDPFGKKPIWQLYRALGTADEDRACAPYLEVIGIKSWDEVIHGGRITR